MIIGIKEHERTFAEIINYFLLVKFENLSRVLEENPHSGGVSAKWE